jgi:GNAT superfamily N-acetyltransferase
VTGYEGLQHEIVLLRNANRDRPETLDYLKWRYRSVPDAPEPRVFWLLHPSGERVGMASAIFRPYRINTERVLTAVIGDISLDARWRGRGLGQVLLRFMTKYLDEHYPRQPAFVIPTESARRALASLGWITPGTLVPYVCVLDATPYLGATLRSQRLAGVIAGRLQSAVRAITRLSAPRNGALFLSNARDDSTFELAGAPSASPGAVHDLGADELNWRYAQHPHTRFVYGRFYRADSLRGIVVFEDDVLTRTCSIYDLRASDPTDLRAMVALLVRRGLAAELTSVRMTLDNRHPARSCLRGLGFIARRADSVFQVHSCSGLAENATWRVTQGDKDT